MQPISLLAAGMATGVGNSAPASCAAIRTGITNFVETRFMGSGGEWLIGGPAPAAGDLRGRAKLVSLAASTIRECLTAVGNAPPAKIPLLLCVAEPDRPGRLAGMDDLLLEEIQAELNLRFHAESRVIAEGRVSGARALRAAEAIIHTARLPYCLIMGVDTILVGPTLSALEKDQRLLTAKNSNGFIPGEAAAAVLLGPTAGPKQTDVQILGVGTGTEPATITSGEPLRADGLVQALQSGLSDAKVTYADLDYRIADLNGEQFYFKEAALALTRTLRVRKERFDIWHPADCIGEVGAAVIPCALAVALAAAQKGYAPGPGLLGHFGNDDGRRAAIILRSNPKAGL